MTLTDYLTTLANEPKSISFADTMAVIDAHYAFSACNFSNHGLLSSASENNGSCKIFAFAKLNGLSKQNTLDCFGQFYREDVLNHPEANNHMNIRTFMLAPETTPFLGISFDGTPLTAKS